MDVQIKRSSKSKKPTLSVSQAEVVNELQKRYFEDDNNFIDYFMEVGVKPEIFKNKILYESDNVEDLNLTLTPQIITKFPNFDKKNVVIENSMIHQIFPHGFKVVESKTKPSPNFYCLVLDNQLLSAIYTKKYLACLIIYEGIEQYKKLYDKFQSNDDKFFSIIKSMPLNNKKKESKNDKYKNYYIPKCLCLVSVHPHINKFEEILRTIYDISISESYSYIFIDQIIEKLIIETPKIPRGLRRIVLKFPNNEIEVTESKVNEFPFSNVNLSYTFEIMNYNNIIDIYKYLLYETKLIFFSENLYKLTNTILSYIFLLTPFNYQFQVASILSKDLYSFIETISPFIFGINEKYTKNFFKKNKITFEDTSICIVDIDNDSHFLIAPGGKLDTKEFPEMPKKLRKKLEDKLRNYLINKKKRKSQIIPLFTTSTFKNTFEESIIQRITTYKQSNLNSKKIVKDVNLNYIKKQNENFVENENNEIQLIFSKFMINLLKDYPKFLTKDYSVNRDITMSIRDLIDLKSYLNLYSSGDREFYNKIFTTQMFMEFIYKRMMPKDCNEKVEVLFIEEKINEKINKNLNLFAKLGKSKSLQQNFLLHSKDYDYDKEIVYIDLNMNFGIPSRLQYFLFNNKSLLNEFLCKGYDISINDDSKEISFTYNIFPSLLSDRLFVLNVEQYQQGSFPFYKEIEEINAKIVNKSSLKFMQGEYKLKNSDSENDLYLCYIILWAMSFWYAEEDEKDYRFLKMLEILEEVEEHDVKIFEILFKSLAENSKDENVILLYKKFIHLRLNPTWEMFSLVSKIIKKKSNISKKSKLLNQETKMIKLRHLFENEKIKKNSEIFPYRRSFKIVGKDDFIFTDNVLFYAYFICKKCNGIINLGEICSNLKLLKMQKDTYGIERIKCYNKNKDGKVCDNLCEQKFKYRFGEELYNQKIGANQIYRFFTSLTSFIYLLSPTEIKNNLLLIAKNLKKEEKFDVENFRFNYPDLFWSLVWYFDLNNIDKSFMLPYKYIITNNTDSKEGNINITYIKNKFNKNNNENNNKNGEMNTNEKATSNIKINKINARNKNNKLKIFKTKIEVKKYKKENLCIQKLFDFAIIENLGLLTYKSLLIYQKNVSYNEMPLLPYERDNNSTSCGSLFYYNDSESSSRTSLFRDSLLSNQTFRRNVFTPNALPISKISRSGPGLSNMGLKLGGRDSTATKCIVFEESDDSLDNN